MQRIKGFDALMYYGENMHASQQVLGLLLLDTSTCPGGKFDRESVEVLLLSRFEEVDLFRKKFVKAPMDLAFPALVDDPKFSLQNHVRHIALPKPGSYQQLADILGSIASAPLDMKRPLWEMTLIDGFEGGKYSVLVTKTHHCLMDGVGGSEMMSRLLDKKPVPLPRMSELEYDWTPDTPSTLALRWSDLQDFRVTHTELVATLRDAGKLLAGKAIQAVGRQLGVLPESDTVKRDKEGGAVLQREMPASVPRLYFNRALTSKRCVAFGELPVDGIKEIREHLSLTFNDVVLGLCSQAMRHFLREHDALPDSNIVATMPISTRGSEGSEGLNQLRIVPVPLPTRIEDPLAALKCTGEILREIKARNTASDSGGIKLTKLVTPRVGVLVSRLYGIEGLADYVRFLKSNVAISTIPGPSEELYFGGARLVSICPVGPPADGVGLTICVMTYQDKVNFAITACSDHLPDVQSLADGIQKACARSLSAVRKKARARARPKARRTQGKAVARKKKTTTKKVVGKRAVERRKAG